MTLVQTAVLRNSVTVPVHSSFGHTDHCNSKPDACSLTNHNATEQHNLCRAAPPWLLSLLLCYKTDQWGYICLVSIRIRYVLIAFFSRALINQLLQTKILMSNKEKTVTTEM